MKLLQLVSDIIRSTQQFLINEFFPWALTYGAPSMTIWLVGLMFSFAIWRWVYKKAVIDKAGVTFLDESIVWVMAILFLIPFWPLFLGSIIGPKLLKDLEVMHK